MPQVKSSVRTAKIDFKARQTGWQDFMIRTPWKCTYSLRILRLLEQLASSRSLEWVIGRLRYYYGTHASFEKEQLQLFRARLPTRL